MLFGISLLAVVVAAGFAYLGKQCLRKRSSNQGVAMAQHWMAFACYVMSGVATAVAAWPLVHLIGWSWLIVGAAFAALGLCIGAGIDIAVDHKPDRFAFMVAKLAPLLILVAVLNWGTFTSSVTSQVHTYQGTMSSRGGK